MPKKKPGRGNWVTKMLEEERRELDAYWRKAVSTGFERGRCPYLRWNGEMPVCQTRKYIDHCRPGTEKCVLFTTLVRVAEMLVEGSERSKKPVGVQVFVYEAS